MKRGKHIEVTIRPLRFSDAAAVQRYASDERVARTTTIPQPYPEDGGKFLSGKVLGHTKIENIYEAVEGCLSVRW